MSVPNTLACFPCQAFRALSNITLQLLCYAECGYAECHYAECCNAECHGAQISTPQFYFKYSKKLRDIGIETVKCIIHSITNIN